MVGVEIIITIIIIFFLTHNTCSCHESNNKIVVNFRNNRNPFKSCIGGFEI